MVAEPPPSAPGPRPAPAPVGMRAVGSHLGAWVWWCESLFSLTGSWVPSIGEAPARGHVAELSRVVGEAGAALEAHLPRPAPVDPREWVVPSSPVAPDVLRALDVEATLERLAGVHRVLVPRLLVAWSGLAATSAAGEERALRRALRHAHDDLAELWRDGEALLHAHLAVTDDGALRAGRHVGAIEELLVRAGGVVPATADGGLASDA